ncbi:MAG: GcrA family cell cycle regulator [Alphaproteobacteria bacterium]
MSWTDERIALLKKMWKEGKSAAEIAKTLGKGVTRNAVIGKAHRMGLSGRPSPIKKPAPAKKEAAAAPARKETKDIKKAAPAAGGKANPALAKEAEELKKIEKEIVPLGGGVSLLELTERMCKWPIGDPREADFTFCGRGIRVGTPYCPDHASMAYQSSSRSRGPSHHHAAVANDKVVAVVEEVPEAAVEADEEEEVA